MAIHAVYKDGVFRPVEPVNLPELCKVLVAPESEATEKAQAAWRQTRIYKILGERYDSGDPAGAERHNEHQP